MDPQLICGLLVVYSLNCIENVPFSLVNPNGISLRKYLSKLFIFTALYFYVRCNVSSP